MKRKYFRARSQEEEEFIKECEENGIDFYSFIKEHTPKYILKQLKEKGFKNLPAQPTLYRWRNRILIEEVEKMKTVSKAEEIIDKEIKEETKKEIDALTFLKVVISKAYEKLDNVTVLDGIKASEMLMRMGEVETPEDIIKKINKALGDSDEQK